MRELIFGLFFGQGIAHFRAEKLEAERLLRVEVWWWERTTPETKERLLTEMRETLGRWVWDGYSVEVFTSERGKPDVIWDPYRERFVPRKAGVLAPKLRRGA